MSATPTPLSGGCHCGNIRVEFGSERAPLELPLRVCACSFCRAHGARTVVDPQGHLTLRFVDASRVSRYRFGHKTADFLVCQICGVYVAAVLSHERRQYSTLNVNVLDVREVFRQPAQPVDYEGEQAAERTARRAATWTPTRISQ
jgi:hypothetical protein